MEFELWDDVAPAHVNSFRKLAQKGYFDGQALHLLALALTLIPTQSLRLTVGLTVRLAQTPTLPSDH